MFSKILVVERGTSTLRSSKGWNNSPHFGQTFGLFIMSVFARFSLESFGSSVCIAHKDPTTPQLTSSLNYSSCNVCQSLAWEESFCHPVVLPPTNWKCLPCCTWSSSPSPSTNPWLPKSLQHSAASHAYTCSILQKAKPRYYMTYFAITLIV